ncbi:3-methyl-2-oxobutanoate dehydrogenase [lipoamide] kinase, mitochondrial-like isoform X2 [Hydractinia symbiolongicarpus]|nr:3-methyl-2-oxobutanoate dehydrogenase [lipoamide] kinase, mitochondrial-like isoform X2 [Hydractinia symbiolongicarpus]XP_057295375.1 3-methyl-2-oxobutanoate dehydrogenase [lipoamide] kinase, mitochondrial-like isoform X2 [Hydractinia symbiolongicarpus]
MLPSTTFGARLLVRNVLPRMLLSRLESTGKVEYGLEKKWAYYNQQAIDKEASRPLRELTPTQLMFAGKSNNGSHLLKSSQFLQEELPRRIARRVKDFQSLPYVVAINPTLQSVYELYLRAFHKLTTFPKIKTLDDEKKYSTLLSQLLNDHTGVVTSLAKAFHEVKHQIPYELLGSLTERTLKSRLGIRLLAEHHLGLRLEKAGYIGVICVNMSPKSIVEKCVYNCKNLCEKTYSYAPTVFVSGHTKARFAHIPAPMEYILQELIKNAMKATVLKHIEKPSEIPPIEITICNNPTHLIIRISDRGGGISDAQLEEIFKYSFSTTKEEDDERYLQEHGCAFEGFMKAANSNSHCGTLSGYGFGLPSSLAYADFLGGSLNLVPMHGLGTDVYLKLSHIVDNEDCFRI